MANLLHKTCSGKAVPNEWSILLPTYENIEEIQSLRYNDTLAVVIGKILRKDTFLPENQFGFILEITTMESIYLINL